MSQEWMIDVLTDLRNFAHKNGLAGLAEQLDDTILVAVTELGSGTRPAATGGGNAYQDIVLSGQVAAGENA
jgi:uncharacterized spore protein YtfJ